MADVVKFWSTADFDLNQLKNLIIDRLDSDPASPQTGQFWFNNIERVYKTFDGTVVKSVGQAEFSVSATHLQYRPVGTSTWVNIMPLPKLNHTQDFINTNTVLVNHGLNRYPSVTVVDTAKTEFGVEIQHIDENSLTVMMTLPMSGKVFCN